MTEPRGIMERLSDVSACDPGCQGRCVECPDDVIRDAKAEILALRQRAEAAEEQMRRQSDHHDEEEQAFDETLTKTAKRANEAEARVAELEAALTEARAALRPFAGLPNDAWFATYDEFLGARSAAAAALAKGGAE